MIDLASLRCSDQPVVPTTIGMRTRRNLADVAEHRRRHREFHRDIRARERFVAIDVDARRDTVNPYSGAS